MNLGSSGHGRGGGLATAIFGYAQACKRTFDDSFSNLAWAYGIADGEYMWQQTKYLLFQTILGACTQAQDHGVHGI